MLLEQAFPPLPSLLLFSSHSQLTVRLLRQRAIDEAGPLDGSTVASERRLMPGGWRWP